MGHFYNNSVASVPKENTEEVLKKFLNYQTISDFDRVTIVFLRILKTMGVDMMGRGDIYKLRTKLNQIRKPLTVVPMNNRLDAWGGD